MSVESPVAPVATAPAARPREGGVLNRRRGTIATVAMMVLALIWLFPLTFLSSACVPVESMPGWLQAFANNQPVTHVTNAMRGLALGGPIAHELILGLIWLAGILAVFAPLAVRAYKRAS